MVLQKRLTIRSHITILVGICALGGLAIATALALGYRHVDRAGRAVTRGQIVLNDMDSLASRIPCWLALVELVASSPDPTEKSVLADRVLLQSDGLLELARDVRKSTLLQSSNEHFTQIVSSITTVADEVDLLMKLNPAELQERRDEIVASIGENAGPLVEMVGMLDETMHLRSAEAAKAHSQQRAYLIVATWVAALVYALGVVAIWRWVTVKLVRPLQQLTESASHTLEEGRRFPLLADGPHEVVQLTSNLSSLVDSIERARDSMKVKAAETEAILESIQAVLIGIDPGGEVVLWNGEATRSFGLIPRQATGRRLDELVIPWEDPDTSRKIMRCLGKEGASLNLHDVAFIDTKGNARILNLNVTSVRYGNRSSGLLVLATDITDQKSLERQLRHAQKLESVGQLAAGIAHEINTPIQYVGHSVHFLQDAFSDLQEVLTDYRALKECYSEDERATNLVSKIEDSEDEADMELLEEEVPGAIERAIDGVTRVANIVGAMKRFAHPGGKELVQADLNEALRTTLTVARNEYRYVADVEENYGRISEVACNLGDINQVLLNLIVNAAHAIEDKVEGTEERGLIKLTTRQRGERVVIEVSDTGSGIDPEIAERIFDPFFTTKKVGKGTGQGLAIAHTLIREKHHGDLEYETEVGVGTTFRIILPVRQEVTA